MKLSDLLICALAIFGVAIIAMSICAPKASAHHNPGGMLPGVPQTPAIQKLVQTKEWTFCFDRMAAFYPDFRNQTYEVNDAFSKAFGMTWREVGVFETEAEAFAAGCQVYHEMLENHPCDGCAAWVFYNSRVCHIQYKGVLGFVKWLTTLAHELGHCFGMHEGYDDINFRSHILTYGRWALPWNAPTVMDVGTHLLPAYAPLGLYKVTAADVSLTCTWLDPSGSRFTGCGLAPVDPCTPGPTDQFGNIWLPCQGMWQRPNGWLYDPATGNEHLPDGTLEYLGCNQDAIRWNLYIAAYLPPFSGYFRPERGFWSFAGPC